MTRVEKQYVFAGPDGGMSLLELFDGRPQLLLYHFMFAPGVHGWPTAGCPGCSMFTDNIGQFTPVHLNARGVSLARSLASTVGEHRGVSQAHVMAPSMGIVRAQLVQRRFRHDNPGRRASRPQRIPARRRRHIPHVFHLTARHRSPRQHLGLPRTPHRTGARKPGKTPPRLAADRALPVVAKARRVAAERRLSHGGLRGRAGAFC